MTTMRRTGVAVVLALAACGTAPDATPEQKAQAERRLLAPFLAGMEVGCGELLVEVTGNLYPYVGQPAVDPERHTKVREEGSGFVDTVWTNTAGVPESAFIVMIGDPPELTETGWQPGRQTRFRVVNQVRLRVYEDRRPLTLNATAGGGYVFVKEASSPPREVAKFAIVDGVLQRP